MKIYLVKYSVKGIKTLDKLLSLSFYKKTITKDIDTQAYNIKAIYGMNGSGKSGIISSVDILRNILINADYLNNPLVQKNLTEMINKKNEELFIEIEFLLKIKKSVDLFKYQIILSKDHTQKYVISYEELSIKNAFSKKEIMDKVFEVKNGELSYSCVNKNDDFQQQLKIKTLNLLETASLCTLFFDKFLGSKDANINNVFSFALAGLYFFGKNLHIFIEQSDDHREYLLKNSNGGLENMNDSDIESLLKHYFQMDRDHLNVISVGENVVHKEAYNNFEDVINGLCAFIKIFKSDLIGIEIDKKEDRDRFICNLIMVYDSYKIHSEFESTGIKKLIVLFTYLREMVNGGIVFIDEFDSNLHDVYLCALLEYLMEYGKGQLCFTTHNVGPMDVLKRHKKSIDFLSMNHKIYPWTTNGNYSPSKLYRNGMIEGSPFNVDSIDFIKAFGISEED